MKFRPFGDRVLIQKAEEEEQKTESGIIVPTEDDKSDIVSGKVLATGPSCKQAKVGDIVLLPNFAGEAVTIGEQKSILISEEDILGAK